MNKKWTYKILSTFIAIVILCGAANTCIYTVSYTHLPFRLGAGRGFSVLSLGLTSFFDFGDKDVYKRQNTPVSCCGVFFPAAGRSSRTSPAGKTAA